MAGFVGEKKRLTVDTLEKNTIEFHELCQKNILPKLGAFNVDTMYTLHGTNISPTKALLKMIFLFPRWDMLIPWRVDPFSFWGVVGPDFSRTN